MQIVPNSVSNVLSKLAVRAVSQISTKATQYTIYNSLPLFHSHLKTYLFHKSFPPWTLFSSLKTDSMVFRLLLVLLRFSFLSLVSPIIF